MSTFTAIPRKYYQKKILRHIDSSNITIVLGVRRSGKSFIARSLAEQMKRRYSGLGRIVYCDFEQPFEVHIDAEELFERFEAWLDPEKKTILFIDEITHVSGWERAVDRAVEYKNVKLVLFSSNRRVLSENLKAYREGRCEVIEALPFSMEEFMLFNGYTEIGSPERSFRERMISTGAKKEISLTELYSRYLRAGSIPVFAKVPAGDIERVVTDGVYCSVITHDIMEIGSYMGGSAVAEPGLLRMAANIMANNMGRNISATWIAKQTGSYLKRASSTKTIESYMHALINAHLFYSAERYDIRAGKKLKTLAKYYPTGGALYKYVTGKEPDRESMLENKVFFELLRRGFEVYNGKLGQDEIKFIAVSEGGRAYIQTADMLDEGNLRRIMGPLHRIRDRSPKFVICAGSDTRSTADGIMIINAMEFLMGGPLGRMRANE